MKPMNPFLRTMQAFALSTAVVWPGTMLAEEGQKQEGQKSEQAASQQDDQKSEDTSSEQASKQNEDAKDAKAKDGEKKDKDQKDKDKSRELQVFELKHRNPQQVHQILSMAMQPAQGHPGVVRQTAGFRGAAEVAEGDKKMMTAFDADKKLLFIRGSEEQISKVEKLIEALDVEDGELKRHEFGDVCLIPIQSDQASNVQTTLTQLGLSTQMVQLGDSQLAVFHMNESNEEKVEQAEKVIQKLSEEKTDEPTQESKSDDKNESKS